MSESNGQVKLWLHPDALRPRDYKRGKLALVDILAAEGHDSCYDFLGTEDMYTWCMWALKSREDPSFTWEQALDTDFHEFVMGGEPPPPTPPPVENGSEPPVPARPALSRKRPEPEPEPSSVSSTA